MVEGLLTPNDRDFDLLRTSRRRDYIRLFVKGCYGFLALLLTSLFISYLIHAYSGELLPNPSSVRRSLFVIEQPWSDSLLAAWDDYRAWIGRHGISTEAVFFDQASSMLLENALNSKAASIPAEDQGLMSQAYLGLHAGVLRLLFLLVASARVWLVIFGFATYYGLISYKPYRKDDALGQMGNGRLFYSGVRAGLDVLADNGAPDVQVRGFACPQMATQAEAHSSAIWTTLKKFGVCNATNEALTRALVKNGATAAYVSAVEDEGELQRAFAGASLVSNTPHIISAALELHSMYSSGNYNGEEAELQPIPNISSSLNSAQYGLLIKKALHQVLSVGMRQELGALNGAEITTAILSMESGKILAHSFEGGKWTRKSNFPHLSARAVLHSMVEYPQDYSFENRNRIRRALIYAARKSSFAPVRMPIDMSTDCWVLRQWMEVLLACPHELRGVAHEVELAGIVREAHIGWCHELFENGEILVPETSAECFATPTNLLVLPVPTVVNLMRKAVSRQIIDRMHTLLAEVGAEQRRRQSKNPESETGPTEQLSFDRVVPRPPQTEIESIAKMHGISPHDLSDWLALRVVLSCFGWLASRVGDYSVPETSVIFAVFKAERPMTGLNHLGLFGRPGMVSLRGSKLVDIWGRSWASRFTQVRKVTMAESQEDYEKLLQGIEDATPPDDEELQLTSTVS